MSINIEKLINGSKQIRCEGRCNTAERKNMVEEAILYFQQNPRPTREEYFGIKNYAGFGDQRSNHPPCYGPKHGSIVFRIDYNRDDKELIINEDGIYVLLTALVNPDVDITKILSEYVTAKKDIKKSEEELSRLAEFKNE